MLKVRDRPNFGVRTTAAACDPLVESAEVMQAAFVTLGYTKGEGLAGMVGDPVLLDHPFPLEMG